MSDSNFDNMLGKLRKFKEELKKYDESRQDGVNVEPPMTAKEKTKKAEFLAMSKDGQWSLHKGDGKSSGSNPPKSANRKRFEKEVKDISPTGEDPERAAEETDSAEIKRKYRAGQGAGASPNRLHKAEECHEDDPNHEKKEKEAAKDIKGKAKKILDMHKMDEGTTLAGPYNATNIEKNVNMSYDAQANVAKKDLPKDAEYQEHKKEPKDRA